MPSGANNRLEARSNVFLGATMDVNGTFCPVRIRNISSNGALIEGSSLPPVRANVRLLRGRLSAVGELAWETGGHAGINFAQPIDVENWVQRVAHLGQNRVDGVVAALRHSGTVPTELEHPAASETLPAISAALDEVCESFAALPGMTLEFAEQLAKLDSLAQALRRAATGRAF